MVDAIYRVHQDLFHIEYSVQRGNVGQVRLARVLTSGVLGALAAGLLAMVPTLVAVADIDFGSAPAIVFYLLAGGVIVLWLYLGSKAGEVQRLLGDLEIEEKTDDLESRHDFMLEVVNAYVVRHRFLEQVVDELADLEESASQEDERRLVQKRRTRYTEIMADCADQVRRLAAASETALSKGRRTKEEHAELLDWAEPILGGFASL